MLKVRVMPTLLWKKVGLVKGVKFHSWRRIGTILPAVRVHNAREVDELVVLDITASLENSGPDFGSIAEWSGDCFVPLTVGGGVKNVETIRQLLSAGADKVSINSAAYEYPELIREASRYFGSQCIVVSIDARHSGNGEFECFSHSGTRPTGKAVSDWCLEVEALGAGEILLTSIERDGTMQGYDIELIRTVTSRVKIPVIANGGCGNYQHMYEAVRDGHASAVAAASIFQFTPQTPLGAKQYLVEKGIAVRNVNARPMISGDSKHGQVQNP
ncbi:MAG: imidazole glycerol phosphate synthase cyclase subunit [Candidatus Omnitrophica bacterium]|nr:imidazole glycerol phosphate synthase cyclase subunit [Candidatus Omnitrophota bacterium]